MAGKGTIGGKIVLEGEKQYRDALKNIKADQAELRSEMKLCNSEFKDSQNSLEALTKKHEILSRQLDAQKNKVDVYQRAMEASAQKQEQAAAKMTELQAALDKAEKEMQQMADSSGDNAQAMEEQAKAIADLKDKLALAEQGYHSAEQKTKSYQTAMNNATADLNAMQEDLDQTAKYMKEAENSTDKCATSINEYGKETQEATEKTSIFGDVLKANLASEVIIDGVKRISDGIKQIADASIETGSNFEASMSQVAATMGMTAEEINSGSADYEKLSNAAKECGKTTKYSASESAEALNYLALAGYDVNKSVETLPKVLDLASAGGLDLAYASDLVTDSMAALGMETKDLDMYIDEMARTSQKSNTSVAQLGEATLVCSGAVTITKQSLETMNAELGVLANNGIKGAEGGTHLRNILLSLAAPTDVAAIALDDLGVKVSDSEGNMRDLNDIMIDLNASMSGMATTEKTQIISRIFNKTDIAAVNALLKGTGNEFDTLMKELEGCSGAAKAMAETMNNNLKGKITILQSALEGLGISAYEIFDDDMKSAVDGATDAVGRLQRSIDSGDLGVSLNKMSEALGEFVEGTVSVGEDALPVMIDGLTWILDKADLVTAGITGVVAANMQMKAVGPAIEAVQAAWLAYKTANEGATVSQWLLNTAMSANPAGLLISAVAGLTAAVAAYCIINKDNLIQQNEEIKKTNELIEKTRALNDEYAKSSKERKESSDNFAIQAVVASDLVAELGELRKKTSLTADEQARMKMIISELNEVVPDLNLAYDEQSGILNKTQGEIDKCIDAYIALYEAQAAEEKIIEIARQQVEYKEQLLELDEQRKVLEEEITKAQNEYNAVMDSCKEKYGDMVELYGTAGMAEYNALMDAKQALEELDAATQETRDSSTALKDEYAYWLETAAENQVIYDAAAAEGVLGEEAQAAATAMVTMANQTSQAFQDMYESVFESVNDQMNLFAKFNGEASLTTQELLSNMQSQVEGLSQWADNMEALADRGINQGLLKHLADMGPEGAGYVSAFVSMTDEELQKANELFEQSLILPGETAGKVAEAYEDAGKMAAEGYMTGIKENQQIALDTAEEMAKQSLDVAKKTLDINSPSRETQKIGEFYVEGLKTGIKNEGPSVLDTVANLCAQIISKTKTCLPEATFREIGQQIPKGLEAGIRAGESGVVKAIEEMCTKAVEKAKAKLEIHSPSRVFEYFGEMSGEGYKGGWRKSMSDINAVIAASLPENVMVEQGGAYGAGGSGRENADLGGKVYHINQDINVYAPVPDLMETEMAFRRSQEEAAREW